MDSVNTLPNREVTGLPKAVTDIELASYLTERVHGFTFVSFEKGSEGEKVVEGIIKEKRLSCTILPPSLNCFERAHDPNSVILQVDNEGNRLAALFLKGGHLGVMAIDADDLYRPNPTNALVICFKSHVILPPAF